MSNAKLLELPKYEPTGIFPDSEISSGLSYSSSSPLLPKNRRTTIRPSYLQIRTKTFLDERGNFRE